MSRAAVMRVLVVHESLFGNTRAVAQAVAAGIASALPDVDVECRSVLDLPPGAAGADLLVVGGPTHFWGVTSALSRAMELLYERRIRPRLHPAGSTAGRRAADTAGVREWLADLPSGRGRPAAAFDTRIERPLTGGAAPRIGRRLRRRGYRLVAAPEAFVVERVAGPLRAGEEDRARAWGIDIATAAAIHPLATIKEFVPPPRRPGWETTMSTTSAPAVVDVAPNDDEPDRPAHDSPSASRSTRVLAAVAAPRERPTVDVTRLLTTAELVVGAVLVARVLARRPATQRARVTMGPGGWVSMKGGTVAVRRASRPFGRPRPLPASATTGRVPVWARIISAVPLQRLAG